MKGNCAPLALAVIVYLLVACPIVRAVAADPAVQCSALMAADFSGIVDAPTQVIAAHFVGATGDMQAHCEVSGYVAPSVGIEVRLPVAWNGKFIQVGSGGHGGVLDYWMKWCPTQEGYACLTTDMGHKGTGADGLWAHQDLQAKVDWGYRATHVATLAGKAITAKYYERFPQKSYFMGCSTGGRQALQEAQRFPWDYDGILAGAPPIDLSLVYLSYAWGYRVTHDVAGRPLLGPEELNRLTARAVARCDLDDGVKDGIVGDPMHCRVDPAQLACGRTKTESCLTPFQLEAVRKLYAGPTDSMGVALTLGGLLPSSEQAYGEAYFGKSGDPPTHLTLFANGFRYLFLSPEPGPGWTLNSIDFDLDPKRMGIMESLVDSSNPDLRRFVAAGGKLLIYQGLNDPITARAAIDYYETVERTLGGRKPTQAAVRLFAIPGMNHCSGGVGADAADFLGALETWVEQGRAPDRILTGHLSKDEPLAYPYRRFPVDPARLSFTRPVYPYPLRAMYRGRGDPNDAASFAPVERRQ